MHFSYSSSILFFVVLLWWTPFLANADRIGQILEGYSDWPAGMSLWGLDVMDGKADQKYLSEYSGSGPVNVYILDSGVETGHPGFTQGQVELIYTAPNVERTTVRDCTGHGSHISGIVGGTVTGVAKNAKISVLRVSGCGATFSNQNIIDALDYLGTHIQKPAVVSIALLPLSSSSMEVERLKNLLVKFVNEEQVPVVMAAGDDATSSCSRLSQIDGLIAVGAHDEQYQPLPNSNHGACTNVFAPGNNIWSHSNQTRGVLYSKNSGTSSASAFVTGAVATLLEANSNLSPAEVQKRLIENSVRSLTDRTNAQLPIIRVYAGEKDGNGIYDMLYWLIPLIICVLVLIGAGVFIILKMRRNSQQTRKNPGVYHPSRNALSIRFSVGPGSQPSSNPSYTKPSSARVHHMPRVPPQYETHDIRESYVYPSKYRASTLHHTMR